MESKVYEFNLPYSIDRSYEVSDNISFKEKKKVVEELVKFAINNKTEDLVMKALELYYCGMDINRLSIQKLEKAMILARFKNRELAQEYIESNNLRMLQILSNVSDMEVYEVLKSALLDDVLVSNLEKISKEKTKKNATNKLDNILINAEKEFNKAYNYAKNNNIEICRELNSISQITDSGILVARAIAVSTELGLNPWNVRKALPINGNGNKTPNFYEGIDLGAYNDMYMTEAEYQRTLKRVKEEPFNYHKINNR